MKRCFALWLCLALAALCPCAHGEGENVRIALTVADAAFDVVLEDSETAAAFAALLPMTLDMSELNGNEKYCYLSDALPRRDEAVGRIEAGDIMLYGGSCVVVFYESFDTGYRYTRIGRVEDPAGLKAALGGGDVQARFEAEAPRRAVRLNSGREMPILGLGTWTLSDEEAEASVYCALASGYRLIDTARYYGNERGVGRGVRRAIEDGVAAREEIFVTSKIMPGDYDDAEAAIDASLEDLGLDYIDLMLIHQPGRNDAAVYAAMEQGVRDGKLRDIGISNYYTPEALDEVLAYAEILPAVIQNENHIYYQNAALQACAAQYGIVIESWYPFGGRGHTRDSFENPVIAAIAEAHGRTPAQVILRWQLQAGYIAIPGSGNPDHIRENFDVFDFALSDAEMAQIAALDRQARYESW